MKAVPPIGWWMVLALLVLTGCRDSLMEKPVSTGADHPAEVEANIQANLAKLSPEDRRLAEEQQFCVVENENRLGDMAVPVKVMVKGQPVFLCCKGCIKQAQRDPEATLAKLQELKTAARRQQAASSRP